MVTRNVQRLHRPVAVVRSSAQRHGFEWPHTGIVRVLRDASQLLSADGWTRLDDVRAWIAEAHSEQTPEKYGRRSWPQVLTESRTFDLQYRVEGDGRKAAWFRVRR